MSTMQAERPTDNLKTIVGETQKSKKRLEIQGLRAVAVVLVIAFHYFPTTLTGGFIGVDVFFVISGYLITSLLLRELNSTGTISLTKFYGRRIRRLMPAAITVTLATIAVASLVMGPIQLVKSLHDAAWVTLYAANIRFGLDPAGYFASGEPSPFLHFWSLAVEEQFYLLWPVLILVAVLLAKTRKTLTIGVMFAAIIVASISASIQLTDAQSAWAYYSLGTRAWELGMGAGLAWVTMYTSRIPARRVTDIASVVGLGAVLVAAVTYTEATPFPGYTAALPTLGTALIIWASTYRTGFISHALSTRPAVYLGDISYSLYLWHWPVLILGTIIAGESRLARVGLIVVALLLAAASYRYVEQRGGKLWPNLAGRRLVAVGVSFVLVVALIPAVGATLIPTSGAPAATAPAQTPVEVVTDKTTITLDNAGPTPPAGVPANATPALIDLPTDLAEVFTNGCYAATVQVCEGGDPNGATRIVLAGDSHAGQWWPALNTAAAANGWKLYLVGKNGCALADVPISQGDTADPWPQCSTWQQEATAAVANLDADLIVYANHAQGYSRKVSVRDNFAAAWSTGVTATLAQFAGSRILYVGQSPELTSEPGTCLSEHLLNIAACEVPLEVAVTPEIDGVGRSIATSVGAKYFDPTQMLCTSVCPLIDGSLVMYRDPSHLTRTYSAALSEQMAEVVRAALVR